MLTTRRTPDIGVNAADVERILQKLLSSLHSKGFASCATRAGQLVQVCLSSKILQGGSDTVAHLLQSLPSNRFLDTVRQNYLSAAATA
eukprot:m.121436 g.121436  ORF g.121436 m.121436 type:complete len:88 (-) comp9606_c0_seq4:40-303(-)